ncbi:uncharacterized protein LOC132902092 [Amyelois transitella]|uniref:uncharacterized protein LOC132902092 n=1 Tax=Amyelois transitella TaxID=680683 RepID=UPI00299050F0|nr:uncharacterized protein LOC132902092 [Amyelois transitella]
MLEKPTPTHQLLHPAQRVIPEPAQNASVISQQSTHTNTYIYTDGSKQEDGSVGAAFVVYANTHSTHPIHTKKLKLHKSCSVFQAELFAILGACRWARGKGRTDVTVYTDSMSSIAAIRNRSNTHPLVSDIHQVMASYRGFGSNRLDWVRGHTGVAGNEAADRAAGAAARLHKVNDYDAVPASHIKHIARTQTHDTWQKRYTSEPQGAHTRSLLPTLKQIHTFFTKTPITFLLTQYLTGHGFHLSYLRRFHITENDLCPCGSGEIQDIDHLLKRCHRFTNHRRNHVFICDNLKIDPYRLTDIMTKEQSMASLIKFVEYIYSNVKDLNGDIVPQ